MATKYITVFKADKYDREWPPENLGEAIAWFQRRLDAIPEEHRASATVEFGSVAGYEDSHYATIEIGYFRPETEAEIAESKAREAMRLEQRRENLKRELARLGG